MRRRLACLLTLALLAPSALRAQTPADPGVAKGIREIEEGELDAGIFTLDAAARRLAGNPAMARELAQAYLYLGIAFVGKAQDTLAKARFRDALLHQRGLALSPDQYPPKVIELFEAARHELAQASAATAPPATGPAAPPAPAAGSAPSSPPAKKGGSKTPLILAGVAVAGGGAALAAKGGGGGSKFMELYLQRKIFPADPFSTLDIDGVGALVELACEQGRAGRPDLKLGICGEHGGDPATIAFCERVGLDYVSCSPYRVPIARLAAAQATLGSRAAMASTV